MGKRKSFETIVNKKALSDYKVLETMEAGVILTGAEAKSVRVNKVSMKNSYVLVSQEGVRVHELHIAPYKYARNEEYEPLAPRKLLLKQVEIERLRGLVAQKGVSVVPLRIKSIRGKFKLELGVVKGKKQYEKREQIKKRDARREVEREVKAKIKM